MDKIRIKQNYEDYDSVKKAFREFVHALVWESMDIDDGVLDDEVNKHIARYCATNQDQMIAKANAHISQFIKSLDGRYSVHLYELNGNGDVIDDSSKHFDTDNLALAIKKAAAFYRKANCPQVNIYDNKEDKYIAEWD